MIFHLALFWQVSPSPPSDIHAAARKIAEINGVELELVQHSLIQKWLQAGDKAQQESDSVHAHFIFLFMS